MTQQHAVRTTVGVVDEGEHRGQQPVRADGHEVGCAVAIQEPPHSVVVTGEVCGDVHQPLLSKVRVIVGGGCHG